MVVAIAAGATGSAARNWNPLEAGQTMTGAISSLAIGSDSGEAGVERVEPVRRAVLRRALAVRVHVALNMVSERFVRRVRQAY